MFLNSHFSFPSSYYGDAHKGIFIFLMLCSCFILCFIIAFFFIIPWMDIHFYNIFLSYLSILFGSISIIFILCICFTIIFNIYTKLSIPYINRIQHLIIKFLLPLMELLAYCFRIDKNVVRHCFIKFNNELIIARHLKVIPSSILLLLPHCIQLSVCNYRLLHNIDNCHRCGKCPMARILSLRDMYGFKVAVATGGTIARNIVAMSHPQCIIAVACERDLTSGIQDCFPIPVYGILNFRPKGPCIDTLVPLSYLESIIKFFSF